MGSMSPEDKNETGAEEVQFMSKKTERIMLIVGLILLILAGINGCQNSQRLKEQEQQDVKLEEQQDKIDRLVKENEEAVKENARISYEASLAACHDANRNFRRRINEGIARALYIITSIAATPSGDPAFDVFVPLYQDALKLILTVPYVNCHNRFPGPGEPPKGDLYREAPIFPPIKGQGEGSQEQNTPEGEIPATPPFIPEAGVDLSPSTPSIPQMSPDDGEEGTIQDGSPPNTNGGSNQGSNDGGSDDGGGSPDNPGVLDPVCQVLTFCPPLPDLPSIFPLSLKEGNAHGRP